MSYRAAICDDSTTDAEFVGSILHQWAAERGIEVESERFASADAFLFRYAEDKSFDLLLLDVEMPGTDGVTLAKTVRQENEAVQIVFITGYSDYIAEGYDVAALHYLVKPVSREKLFAVLDRAWEKHRRNARCLNLELPASWCACRCMRCGIWTCTRITSRFMPSRITPSSGRLVSSRPSWTKASSGWGGG